MCVYFTVFTVTTEENYCTLCGLQSAHVFMRKPKKKIKHRAHALNPGALKMLSVITFNLFVSHVGFDLQ